MNLTIDPEFEAFIPPLDAMDYAHLKANILADGCREPISVWNGTILDGHNRYRICTENGIPFSTIEISSVHTRAEAFVWMYENQLGRRNLEPFMRAEMALKVKPYIEERARERSRANLKQNAGSTEWQNSATREKPIRTDEKLAEKANVSRNTIQRVEKILEKAKPEVIEKARSGEISINQAYQTVKPAKKQDAKPVEKPEVKPQTQAEKDQAFIDGAMADGPTLDEMVDELERENEQLYKKIESLAKDDKDAEIIRLQEMNAMLSRQIDTLTETKAQAEKDARYAVNKLREIGKLVGDEDFRTIVSTVRKALGK
nr:MAG TPA: putative chromosome partitioning protein [Caudoviricetes sp.]